MCTVLGSNCALMIKTLPCQLGRQRSPELTAAGKKARLARPPQLPTLSLKAGGLPELSGRGRGERGPLASCRGHLRRGPAAGDRREEQGPHRRHWAGRLRDPLPFRDLALQRGTPGRVGCRSWRFHGTSAGPRRPPEVAGFHPPTLFKTSWREGGGSVGRDRTSTQASTPSSPAQLSRPAPPPRKRLRCRGHHVLGQDLASALSCRCRLTTRPPWHSGNRAAGPRN
ncbi:unnamed protein product [Rangifer tarandus platyrhynchus]|uniref:Uncharacterized protein n=2 Tax=Rangifer tarandus platyrhynchus TaxID=3082113 RepID=A0ABN8Y1F9_RANTA|nr:unnamed protein product [Rangifer tarandus platyrhynchus]CAI9693037.1 unnamed protein product [Rangifer tarandus platyrhynchus]